MRMIAALAAAFVAVMTTQGDVKPPRPRPAAWELADVKSRPHTLVIKKRAMDSEPPLGTDITQQQRGERYNDTSVPMTPARIPPHGRTITPLTVFLQRALAVGAHDRSAWGGSLRRARCQ